jgi:hypothetical protein
LFHLGLQVSPFFWTYDICFISVYKFRSFSGRTTFVSFESTSFIFFLDVRHLFHFSGVTRNFVRGEGGSTNSVEDKGQRERRSGGGSPLVRGSEGSCNLVLEISFHITFLNF